MEVFYFSPMLLGLNLLVAIAIASTALWRMSRPIPGPEFWMAGSWTLIVGVVLFIVFMITRNSALNVMSNAFQMAGEAIFLLGIFRFLERPVPYWIVPASVLVVVGFNVNYWVTDGNSDFLMTIYSGIAGLLPAQAVWVLMRQRIDPATRPAQLLVGACLAFYSLVTLLRAGFSWQGYVSQHPYTPPNESFSYLLPLDNFAIPALVMAFIGVTLMTMQRILASRRELESELKRLATIDPLTGALNRRSFKVHFDMALENAAQRKQSFCAALLDLDHFKEVNDTQGHQAGDEALRMFSEICRQHARADDIFARFGGEEFILLMPATTRKQAEVLLQRLLQKIAEIEVVGPNGTFQFRASAGISEYRANDRQDSLMQRADKALYRAKHAGRNRVFLED